MADQNEYDSSALQQLASAVRNESTAEQSNSSKRKRGMSPEEPQRPGSKQRTDSPEYDGEGSEFMDTQQGDAAGEVLQEYSNMDNDSSDSTGNDHANASNTAVAAMAMFPSITIPTSTSDAFQAQADAMDESQMEDQSFADGGSGQTPGRGGSSKPAVGSEEWHKVRKDNHKEVERRRRETINEGINELAKIVPGCEKNKGSILARAVSFITQLKENEAQNIEKWTLEKLLTEQAIAELSASNDKLKAECERAWREGEAWKKTCQAANLAPKREDAVVGSGET